MDLPGHAEGPEEVPEEAVGRTCSVVVFPVGGQGSSVRHGRERATFKTHLTTPPLLVQTLFPRILCSSRPLSVSKSNHLLEGAFV